MRNDRPIEDPKLQKALNEVHETMARYGLAGACMLVSAQEAAFAYKMHAPWSACRYDPAVDLGFRIRVIAAEIGREEAQRRMDAAVHTICQLADFGAQTMDWMEQLKQMLRQNGIEWDHTPYGGKPLPSLIGRSTLRGKHDGHGTGGR